MRNSHWYNTRIYLLCLILFVDGRNVDVDYFLLPVLIKPSYVYVYLCISHVNVM